MEIYTDIVSWCFRYSLDNYVNVMYVILDSIFIRYDKMKNSSSEGEKRNERNRT